jgi:hypothetical protein
VPLGYGMTIVALPAFALFGAADTAWHELLGIETTTDIFFSPSHLGLATEGRPGRAELPWARRAQGSWWPPSSRSG